MVDDEGHLWIPAFDYGADRLAPSEPESPVVNVSSGVFYGECGGYCKTSIHLEPNRKTFIASAWDHSLPTYRQYTYGGNDWTRILATIDCDTFVALPETIGCPDCADGGGEWIEISIAGASHRVTFEAGATIESIQPLIDSMRAFRNEFNIPEPKIDSLLYVRVEDHCEGLCRRQLYLDQNAGQWHFSDPKGQVRSRTFTDRTDSKQWDQLNALVDWRVVQELAARELAICDHCPGTEWIEIRGLNQNYRIPAWFPEVSDLRNALLCVMDRFQVKPEASPVTRIEYGSNFGFCAGYCTRHLLAEKQILQLSATSRSETLPPIEEKMEIGAQEWGHLLLLAEASEIESYKEVIGCPDCADGGSEWIRIWRGEDSHKVTFEYGNPPDSMAEMIDMLRGWMHAIPTEPEEIPE